jgi:hypothetical protein
MTKAQPHKVILAQKCAQTLLALCLFLLANATAFAQSQVNAADLRGTVTDETGAVISGAKVTLRNEQTNDARETTADGNGVYQFIRVPPGQYEVSVEAPNFSKSVSQNITLTVGQVGNFDVALRAGSPDQEIVEVSSTQVIETSKTAVSNTVNQTAITNLPSNGRSFQNFTLTLSSTTRDNQPVLGTAPTSGLNFGGQRARANNVSIDGADASDSAVNGVRATVSQEGVQEFQVQTNSYAAEYGRASAAVINIVTKGGGNEIRGNLFGFLRDQAVSANNPFAGGDFPSTRFQGGFTIGGPIKKDKIFYFLSFEATQRNETGFSQIGRGGFGLQSFAAPTLLATTPLGPGVLVGGQSAQLTPAQVAFFNQSLGAIQQSSGIPTLLQTPFSALPGAVQAALLPNLAGLGQYLTLAREGASVGLTGRQTNGAPIFPILSATAPLNPVPAAFASLNQTVGNYSQFEKTYFPSLRLDYKFNDVNNFFMRVSVTPSTVSGLPSNGQNQPTGLNAFSRTGFQGTRDFSVVFQNVSTISGNLINEARVQIARRGVDYGGNGGAVGVEVPGFASFGREPFSPTQRVEKRTQITDNVTLVKGNHTIKFGGDYNLVVTNARFEVNFGGIYNFPELSAGTLGFPTAFPNFSAVQSYGLGVPESFVQNTGNPVSNFNTPFLGGFVQDSWKIRPNVTLNYGLRYDVQYNKQIGALRPDAFPDIFSAGERVLGIQQGIPRDNNNFAPRIALAYDPFKDGKTVIRASYGLFYGTPLGGLTFLSDVVDGAQSPFLVFPGLLGGASIFRGSRAGQPFPVGVDAFGTGFAVGQQRLDQFSPVLSDPITALSLSPITSQTLHINRGFESDYTSQASLTVERQIAKDLSFSATYSYIKGSNLVRPRNINQQNLALLQLNQLAQTNPFVLVNPANPAQGIRPANPGESPIGFLGTGPLAGLYNPLTGGIPGAAAGVGRFFFNDFRASGPNTLYTASTLGIPFANAQTLLNNLSTRFNLPRLQGSPFVPFGSVKNYESSGGSVYHALTLNLNKRFSQNFQFLGSYTYSHAIDDSTDVQTLQEPQDNSRPGLDRSNSNFDQRHRFVLSGVFQSPFKRGNGLLRTILADFTLAPIIEVSSGRPYNVLIGVDQTQVNSSSTARPNVVPLGTPGSFPSPDGRFGLMRPPDSRDPANFGRPLNDFIGNLGRNVFTTPFFATVDLRVARRVPLPFSERQNLELIVEAFNLFNKTNINEVLVNFQNAGAPISASPARQLQFAVKYNF